MARIPLAIQSTGLVTSVGLGAAASCAAMRAGLTNPVETKFIDARGAWIMAHQVPLAQPWRGMRKLVVMASMAVEEALQPLPREAWGRVPLLLCVAESERPGRTPGLDQHLYTQLQDELGVQFAEGSAIVPRGRVGVAVALSQARTLLARPGVSHVLVAAADSLLSWPTLSHYDQADRLLTEANPDGFMPGEGAGALLLGCPSAAGELLCTGLGFGLEAAHVESGEPLRAEGLSTAIRAALADAGREMHDMDFRITDVGGEQYYFKEAALALSRTLRVRKEELDIWHPAESTGEIGAATGASLVAVALAASRKGYARGRRILAHASNDAGHRAAMVLEYRP